MRYMGVNSFSLPPATRQSAARASESAVFWTPWGKIPMLSLTPIRRKFNRLSISAMEGLVHIQHRLHRVVPRRNLAQLPDRITRSRIIHRDTLPRPYPVDGHAEDHLTPWGIVNLHPRLLRGIVRQQQQQSPIQCLCRLPRRERYGNSLKASLRFHRHAASKDQNQEKTMNTHGRSIQTSALIKHSNPHHPGQCRPRLDIISQPISIRVRRHSSKSLPASLEKR